MPANAPQGHCLACLLRLGLTDTVPEPTSDGASSDDLPTAQPPQPTAVTPPARSPSRAWTTPALITVLTWFSGLVALWFPAIGDGLSQASYDLPQHLRTTHRPDEAVILFMDEESRSVLGLPADAPWPRDLQTRLVERLKQLGARAVVFDVLMDASQPGEDAALATAMRAHGRVFLGARLEVIPRPVQSVTPILPNETLRTAAAGWGVVELEWDSDARIRRVASSEWMRPYPELARVTAESLGKTNLPPLTAPRWLNFYGPNRALPWHSYHQALASNGLPARLLTDKIVFVGEAPRTEAHGTAADLHSTPVGRLAGVEILTTAFLNLWREDSLTEASPWSQMLLVALVALGCGFGMVRLRPPQALLVALVTAGALAALGILGVGSGRVWFPWMIPAVLQVPLALALSLVATARRLDRERADLKSTLDQLRVSPPNPTDFPARNQPDSVESTPSPAAPPFGITTLGDHELVRAIGRGAYGEVWLARSIVGVYRALKIVRRDPLGDSRPFDREFRGIEEFMPISLGHPGLVNLLHVGRDHDRRFFFYIMELGDDETRGTNLDVLRYSPRNLANELRRRGCLALPEALDLVLPVCEALEHLHSHSLVHRDIKPSNIIFVNGRPKLADIGLVASTRAGAPELSFVGTDGFVPPEGPGRAPADIYALGKVLAQLTLGRTPQSWPSPGLEASAEPPEPAPLGASGELEIILERACANLPRRYATCAALKADLLALRNQQPR